MTGNLTLAGTLNITSGGNFGSGAYRLLNYTGGLTDLTLALGSLPTGFTAAEMTVTTAVAGQVNLVVNAAGAPAQFWDGSNTVFDGTVHGGNGTWDNFAANFTNGTTAPNQSWQNGVAMFAANPGTVTLGADIFYQGMQFSSDLYTVVGAGAFALHPTGLATIFTDPGVTATISAPIVGLGGLNKAGDGLLALTGVNTYGGGTTISAGILRVTADSNLGNLSGGVTLHNGELLTTADGFSSDRPITLATAVTDDALVAATGTVATYTGVISGPADLTVGDGINAGTVVLTGNNTYGSGNTLIKGLSTLQLGNAGTSGSIIGNVTDNGNLVFNRSDLITFSGNISGAGSLGQNGTGTTILTGTNSYAGATTVLAGTLQVDGTLGNTAVTVQNAGILSGRGTISGPVTIQDGGHLAPGPAARTLGVGNLTLSSGSILDYLLSTPGVIGGGVNTLVNVTGNLTLAGTLNITNGGNFGSGAYRLLNYTGGLSDLTLALGSLPTGFTAAEMTVTTAVAGQVNLVVNAAGAKRSSGTAPRRLPTARCMGGRGPGTTSPPILPTPLQRPVRRGRTGWRFLPLHLAR